MEADTLKNLAEWSRAVIARDTGCVRCGSIVALQAHHKKPKSIFPELALDVDNGETLCANCHWLHHAREPVKGPRGPQVVKVMAARIKELEAEVELLKMKLENRPVYLRSKHQFNENGFHLMYINRGQ